MADIRINSLPTTASASSSDDFLALDGATNGTRKLNAYSPTFGGNVTASGNLTVSGVTTSAGISNSGALTFTAAIGQVAGSIAKNATYGLTYYGVTGSSNDNTMLNASGAVVLSNPAGTTNATLSGNLTVSGGQALISHSGSYANIYFAVTGSSYSEIRAFSSTGEFRTNSGPSAGWGGFLTWQTDASEKMRLTNSGNFLIGTNIDAGGKLQIATGASNTLLIGNDATYTSYNQISLNGTRTNSGVLGIIGGGTGDSQLYLLAPTGGGLLFQIAASTVFSVNSSGNATFAGNTTAKGTTHYFGADNSQRIELTSNNGSSQGLVEFYNRGTSAYFAARYLASSHTFEQGPIAINNTVQTAVAVASTHKVTISIGGSTYYLLATNV